jgi:rhamnosyltransferase
MAGSNLDPTRQDPKVAALVVTYFPDPQLPGRLDKLLEQVRRLVVVDNGSGDAALGWAADLAGRDGIAIERNDANLGIAAALNRGMRALAAEGYDWVVTLDQDSTVEPGFVDGLLATVAADADPDSIALVGGNRRDSSAETTAHRWVRPKRGVPFFERVTADRIGPDGVTLVITSGTLTSVTAFDRLGGFREDLFIDFVDSEYCLRAHEAGYRILVSPRARILHRVGAKRRAALLGVHLSPMHHGALRKYYIFRNAVAVIRRYGLAFPHWLIYQLLALAEIVVGIVFFERDKAAKLKACLIGIWDGLAGRMGPARRGF